MGLSDLVDSVAEATAWASGDCGEGGGGGENGFWVSGCAGLPTVSWGKEDWSGVGESTVEAFWRRSSILSW
jgi:hypothetical protein